MEKDEYTFQDSESGPKNKRGQSGTVAIDKVLADTRRVDDALLHALSLVLSSNSEYARSVSALLENDLTRDQVVTQIHNKTQELLEQTKNLVDSQKELSGLLADMNTEYKGMLETVLDERNKKIREYLEHKFSALFLSAGLRPDGTDHAPTDKLILTIKTVFTQKIWIFIAGGVLYHFAMLLSKHSGW